MDVSRRLLLRWLAASPLFLPGRLAADDLADPADALNVFDFERIARSKLPPAHWAYMATGVDDDATLRANREGYARLALRMHRLVDTSRVDTSITLFGRRWPWPLALDPVSSQRAFHPDGELGTARAAKTTGSLMMLSTVASTAVEAVNAVRGEPVWYQLYTTDDWRVTAALLARVRRAGCPVVVLTVDLQAGSNRETAEHGRREDTRACIGCHVDPRGGGFGPKEFASKPMFAGLDLSRATSLVAPDATWEMLRRLRGETDARLLVKGIVTGEDAATAVDQGADGIVVSNHGGRAEESGRSTIACLPEVVAAVKGRVPVLIDGGIRRGTDIFKALALGANAVCIGRPQVWGLAAFGQPGVEAVIGILRREFELVMRQAGTTSVGAINDRFIASAA